MSGLTASSTAKRVDWVDYGKGICIILVVMMHSTLGVEKALGATTWMHTFIEWARPFRMPDFFLISGLFLAARIDRPWCSYLDSKVVHFAYFYVLWMTIQFVLKAKGFVAEMGVQDTLMQYLQGFVDPWGTLWFIYMLAVFFIVTKATLRIPVPAIWLAGAAMEMARIHTGWLLVDEFTSRFVYFYSGYVLAPHVFRMASSFMAANWLAIVAGLVIWGFGNGWMVFNGYADLPGLSLALGFIGCGAVVAFSCLLVRARLADDVRYCGENSIVIYLAFFLFMAATRVVLIKTGFIADGGMIAAIVTAAGVIGPLGLNWIVKRTPARFVFVRPEMFKLDAASAGGHEVADIVNRPGAMR
jgi:uncharacterized membrane protein YcfT